MKSPKVAIIICTYNQDVLLEKCLLSLKNKTNYNKYKVYFVDDSGKGEIGKKIKKDFLWVNVTINKKNLGFAGANNVGIKKAIKEYNPEYFLLLNDDTEIIQKDWLKEMVEVGESDKKIGILGCKIIYPDGSLQNIGGYLKKWEIARELNENKKNPFEVDHVMGAFLLVKKEVIKKIDFLDENYNPYLLEDTDYCLNARKNGFKILSVPRVKIVHKKGKSIDSLKNKEIVKVRMKNDIYFSRKNLSGWNKFFRIFVYLPLVAILKKKKDIDGFEIKNLKLRKDFLKNLYLWILAFNPEKHKKIWKN